MKSMDLMEIMGSIRDKYILEANNVRQGTANTKQKKTHRPMVRNIAAAVAIILVCVLFFQTPMGAAAAEIAKEQVTKLIETLFPPKDIVVAPEGQPEAVPHFAQGRAPEETAPGFAIYVDTESYTMTEENGVYFIRPISAETPQEDMQQSGPELPACEMEIREVIDQMPSTVAETARQQLAGSWETVSEIRHSTRPPCLLFSVSAGSEWDSPQERHYFYENGKQGTFHIILRYFLEAAEGHGIWFHTMLNTFTVVMPQTDTAPEPLIPGQSGIDDVVSYWQEKYPDKALKACFLDFDGNGFGDLAVWYDDAFRALYMMEEGYILAKEYLLEDGFDIYEAYHQGVNQIGYEGSLIGTTELRYGVEYRTFFRVMNSNLYLLECVQAYSNGADSSWLKAVIESWDIPYDTEIALWDTITEEKYNEIVDTYQVMAYDLKPIDAYHLR